MTKNDLIQKKIAAISLGCDKNRVDLEHALYLLEQYGFEFSDDLDQAQIILINTCSFILPAKQEAIDNILLAISKKTSAICEKVVVMGCLPSRNLEELQRSLPEVDYFLQVKDNNKIVNVIEKLYEMPLSKLNNDISRKLTNVNHYAYLKIADGCNNCCSFCAIPRIRGRYKSVEMKELVKEAKILTNMGVKEIILVAQDTTRYGIDLYDQYKLVELIQQISSIKEIRWIRLLYAYPELVDEKLLNEIKNNPKVCKYIDMPLQHIDNDILKSMNRRVDEKQVLELTDKLKNYPEIAVRSTFIVGYPGETRKQFKKLCEYLNFAKFSNVGFFTYFKEENTKAYFMKKQKSKFIKNFRLKKIQKIQSKIADDLNKSKIGKIIKVLIDGFDENLGMYFGHDNQNAPGIDFVTFVNDQNLKIGEFYDVQITEYEAGCFYSIVNKGEEK